MKMRRNNSSSCQSDVAWHAMHWVKASRFGLGGKEEIERV